MNADSLTLPVAGQNNIWYSYQDKSETLIVFVHGIIGDSRSTWLSEDAAGQLAYWPNLILQDKNFPPTSIFLGGYSSKIDSGEFLIQDAAQQLWQALSGKRKAIGHPDDEHRALDKRYIIFITHSMGGIVVRHMLVKHQEVFKDKAIGLVLIASPSFGSEYANTLNPITKAFNNAQGRQLEWGNQFLIDLDGDFRQLTRSKPTIDLDGVELVENHLLRLDTFKIIKRDNALYKFVEALYMLVVATRSQIVNRFSAVRYFSSGGVIPDSDHITIVKPGSRSDETYMRVKDFYTEVFLKHMIASRERSEKMQDVLCQPGALRKPKDQREIDEALCKGPSTRARRESNFANILRQIQ